MASLKKRSEIDPKDTWDITALYPTLNDWESDYQAVEASLEGVGSHRGKLADSAESLATALEVYLSTSRLVEKVHTYSHLLHDQDLGDSSAAGVFDRASNLYTRFAAVSSYLQPELLAIEDSKIEEFLQSKLLEPYRRTIREIVRYRSHTLSEREESLLANASEVFGTAHRVFAQLNDADLSFGTIRTGDGELTLTHATYAKLLRSQDRDLRRRAYEQYLGNYTQHRNTFAATLAGGVKKTVYLAQVRNFSNALESALFSDEVPTSVYTNLISTVSQALPALHRYFSARKKILKLDDLRVYDNFVPLASDVKLRHSFEEAAALVIDACKPLGQDYVDALRKGLTSERWVDIWENQGKRSGAYSSGCYDSRPYILMNYQEDVLDQVFTLAHEAGHSMHSHLSKSHQSYQDASYTIFVAEVASVLNEQLLLHTLREKYASNPAVLRYLLNHQIDEAFGTFFIQTMFAEFELTIHQLAEQNEALTTDRLAEEYARLIRKFMGPEFTFGDNDGFSAFRIPHFYYNFYVYKYATGYASAVALSQRILSGDTKTTAKYLEFLKSGCRKAPLELLKDTGVDLTTPAPIADTITAFNGWIDCLEETYDIRS